MYLIISTDKNKSFAVARANKKIEAVIVVDKPFKQTELLLKNIQKVIDFKKLKGIIVNQGPGEFSALRIGIATANALAFALDIPIVGVMMKSADLTQKEIVSVLWEKGQPKLGGKTHKIILPFYDKEPNITIKK